VEDLSMPKSDSAQTLLKRLQKIERAQGRLGDITTRILAQAETLAELLKVAQAFAGKSASPKAASRARSAGGVKKASSAKRGTRKAASSPRAATTKRAAPRAPAAAKTATATTRRRPRGTASSV
jgi:hypothetical protein